MPADDPSVYFARMLDTVARVRRARARQQKPAPAPLPDAEGEAALEPKDA